MCVYLFVLWFSLCFCKSPNHKKKKKYEKIQNSKLKTREILQYRCTFYTSYPRDVVKLRKLFFLLCSSHSLPKTFSRRPKSPHYIHYDFRLEFHNNYFLYCVIVLEKRT